MGRIHVDSSMWTLDKPTASLSAASSCLDGNLVKCDREPSAPLQDVSHLPSIERVRGESSPDEAVSQSALDSSRQQFVSSCRVPDR